MDTSAGKTIMAVRYVHDPDFPIERDSEERRNYKFAYAVETAAAGLGVDADGLAAKLPELLTCVGIAANPPRGEREDHPNRVDWAMLTVAQDRIRAILDALPPARKEGP